MRDLWFKIKGEPVAFAAVVRLGVLMLTVYGVQLSNDQIAATMAFVEAFLLFITRQSVTPNTKVDTTVTIERTGGTGPDGVSELK